MIHDRIENANGQFDMIVSRAFTEFKRFAELTMPLLKTNGCLLAMKGEWDPKILEEFPTAQFIKLNVKGLDAQRCLIKLKK